MWYLEGFFVALVLAAVLVLVFGKHLARRVPDVVFFVAICAGLLALLPAIIMPTAILLGRHYGRVNCEAFAQQTNRQTKFVIYNSFASGQCLTPTADGKWIPTDNLREFGDGR